MNKETKLLNDLALLMIEFKACYSCFNGGNAKKQGKALKDLFKAYNCLINARYEVLRGV